MEPSRDTASEAATQPYAQPRGGCRGLRRARQPRARSRALEAIGVEIVIGEREGARFRDAYSGRWYWNCHCNGGVFNLGHRNPAVVAAPCATALDHLDVGNHHLVSGWRARLAEQLAESTGGRLPYAIFTPSGTEAVDLALRLARAHTGRPKIVSTLGAYHGLSGLRAGGQRPALARAVRPRPERVRARAVQRRRGDARRDRRRDRRRDPRVDPGDARLPAARARLPARGRRGCARGAARC